MAKEYINRKVVKDAITADGYEHFSGCLSSSEIRLLELMLDSVSEIPAADVAEVVHGKWIDVLSREVYIPDEKTTITLTEEKCSNCNVATTFKGEKTYLPDYVCPNCGAKME